VRIPWIVAHTVAAVWNGVLLLCLGLELFTTGNLSISAEAAHTISASTTIIMLSGFGCSIAVVLRALLTPPHTTREMP
jgi:hypothetical protein